MATDDKSHTAAQVQQLVGALELIDILREEMEQWLEEAQDDSKRECLENVVGHIGAIEENYRNRLTEMKQKVGG
jgi:hypothetical protein